MIWQNYRDVSAEMLENGMQLAILVQVETWL